jgi:hypothetical protein
MRRFFASRVAFAGFAAAAFCVLLLASTSCGSKTGLFGPEGQGLLPDGALADARPPVDGQVPCVPGEFDLELARAQLMFVLDRSGSMAFTLDGRREQPRSQWRWTILRNALEDTIVGFDQQMQMGAKFFPEPMTADQAQDPAFSCRTESGVGIAPKLGNASSIIDVFDTTEPLGGTPTAEAVRLAAQFVTTSRSVARTIVLATDGEPNCNGDLDENRSICTNQYGNSVGKDRFRISCLDDTRTVDAIREVADNQKVPIYVIGIGNTFRPEYLRVLEDMATAGGRPRAQSPRYYSVQTSAEMTDAFSSIRDSVTKCTYLTPSSPVDPDAISVEIDGVIILRDPTRQNGWDWVDQSFGEMAFFGTACERAQTGAARVTGVVSCERKD